MCEKENINAAKRRPGGRPRIHPVGYKRKPYIYPCLKPDRPRNQRYPRIPSDHSIHLIEALANAARPWIAKGLASDDMDMLVLPYAREEQKTIKQAFANHHGMQFGVDFAARELGGKKVRAKPPARWAKPEKPPTMRKMYWPPVLMDSIESYMLSAHEFLWKNGLPSALVLHTPHPATHDPRRVLAAFSRVKRQLAGAGLTFAEPGEIIDWDFPPHTGMLLVVRMDDERFPHIKSQRHLLRYLGHQRQLARVLFRQVECEYKYRMSMSPEKYAQRVLRAKVKHAHRQARAATRNRQQEASEQAQAHQITHRAEQHGVQASGAGVPCDVLLHKLAEAQARYRRLFERLAPGVAVMQRIHEMAELYAEGIMLREEQAEAELRALLADFEDAALKETPTD